jgi:PIN domain nuclease of toxin-antitoxin system
MTTTDVVLLDTDIWLEVALPVAVDAVHLPAWDHRDPADRMIVATARHLGAVRVTRDAAILDYAATGKGVRVLEPA